MDSSVTNLFRKKSVDRTDDSTSKRERKAALLEPNQNR